LSDEQMTSHIYRLFLSATCTGLSSVEGFEHHPIAITDLVNAGNR